ncbi:hypothetical protein EUGRSUZ_F04274 [Eucalyptus grandis]|uniref:Uncharacterized protein n=2 Tax=Eucalyptus grandis TaxID=71139 RepID=A0ACC3KQ25_EUCGR|nr:hypothetical protein EUGRSUZ_F04274 [Eucalyptus grandis]
MRLTPTPNHIADERERERFVANLGGDDDGGRQLAGHANLEEEARISSACGGRRPQVIVCSRIVPGLKVGIHGSRSMNGTSDGIIFGGKGFPYGLPFISPNNILLSTITGTGAIIESTYVLIFVIYAPKMERTKIFGLVALAVAIFSTVALVSFFVFDGKTRKLFTGVFVDIFAIAMFASPLSIMRLVIKTKSVEFMPFFLSLFGLLCAVSWTVFGLINSDPFVIVPNALGSGLGIAQMILYAIYHERSRQHDNVVKDGSLERDLQITLEKQQPETHQLEHGRIL